MPLVPLIDILTSRFGKVMQTLHLDSPVSAPTAASTLSERAWALALTIVGLCLLANMILLLWGLNKGLDVDVESFYLVQYQNPTIYPAFSSFHLLLSKIPKLVSNEILHYRFLEIAARMIPAVLITVGFSLWANRWLHLSKLKLVLLAVFAALGGSVVFCCFPRTISYNGLSSGLLTLSTASVFFAVIMGDGKVQQITKTLLLFAAGFVVALSMFVKVTSGFALLPALLVFMFFQKCKLRDYVALLSGAAGGVAFFFTCIQGITEWWNAFSEATKFELLTDHSPKGMFAGTITIVRKHWWHGLGLGALVYGANMALSKAGELRQHKLVSWFAGAFVAMICVCGYVLIRDPGLMHGRESLMTIITLVFFATLLSVKLSKDWQFNIGVLLLLALPAIAAVGTNCKFLPHAMSNAAPWFALVMTAAFVCAKRFKAPYAMAAVPIALALFSSVQFFDQYVNSRDDSISLLDQTCKTTKMPLLSGMELQSNDISFYEHAQEILRSNGFKPGDNLLSLYDFPVIVYLMQAVSPGQSWYISWPERDEINAAYFRKASFAKNQRFFMVLCGDDPKKIVAPEMQEALLDPKFGKSFKRIGVLPHPRKPDYKVYFYAGKSNLN
jgi:hypothetical protein